MKTLTGFGWPIIFEIGPRDEPVGQGDVGSIHMVDDFNFFQGESFVMPIFVME